MRHAADALIALIDAGWNAVLRVGFLIAAVASLQYQDQIAPHFDRLSANWADAALGAARAAGHAVRDAEGLWTGQA